VSLTAADVAEIMRLVEGSSFDELSLELNGLKLHLRRGGTPVNGASGDGARFPNSVPTASQASPPPQPVATPAPTNSTPADPSLHEVTAPLLGTFYRAPKPGSPPFVERGSTVEPDTVIGIIEVMKLMNSVHAGVHGTVIDILPSDGALVEYGETILRVAKSG